MFQKFIIFFLVFIMVHSAVIVTSYQYQDTELSIEIVEEEETKHGENSSQIDEKIQEYTLFQHTDVAPKLDNWYHFYKKLHYYRVHIIDHDEKPPLDNPPEA